LLVIAERNVSLQTRREVIIVRSREEEEEEEEEENLFHQTNTT